MLLLRRPFCPFYSNIIPGNEKSVPSPMPAAQVNGDTAATCEKLADTSNPISLTVILKDDL